MSDSKPTRWKPGFRDALFLAVVAGVIITLSLGGGKRTTKAVPDDAVHHHAKSRAACMLCHGSKGINPQPKGHTKEDQCFLCHSEPVSWKK